MTLPHSLLVLLAEDIQPTETPSLLPGATQPTENEASARKPLTRQTPERPDEPRSVPRPNREAPSRDGKPSQQRPPVVKTSADHSRRDSIRNRVQWQQDNASDSNPSRTNPIDRSLEDQSQGADVPDGGVARKEENDDTDRLLATTTRNKPRRLPSKRRRHAAGTTSNLSSSVGGNVQLPPLVADRRHLPPIGDGPNDTPPKPKPRKSPGGRERRRQTLLETELRPLPQASLMQSQPEFAMQQSRRPLPPIQGIEQEQSAV